MTDEEKMAFVERVGRELCEHFDHVQILTSWSEGGLTKVQTFGCGNWYARIGMAREFIVNDDARTAAREIHSADKPDPPEDGDSWKIPTK